MRYCYFIICRISGQDGKLFAGGTAKKITNDPNVRKFYLGKDQIENKEVKISGFEDKEAAIKAVEKAAEMYKKEFKLSKKID